MQLTTYTNALYEWVRPLITSQKMTQSHYRCCISITDETLSILYVNHANTEIEMLYTNLVHYDKFDDLKLILSGLSAQHGLKEVPTYLLLPPDDYQVLLIDSLIAQKNEITDALSWRIRSLINYPITDACFDYFELPGKKTTARQALIAAVVCKRALLTKWTQLFETSGFTIQNINVPEMAMRNLTATFESDEKSSAFIYFYENLAIFNITREKNIYFTRHIQLAYQDTSFEIDYEAFSLEILRYFDYYQSHWRHPAPSRFYVAGNQSTVDKHLQKLSQFLPSNLQKFSPAAFQLNESNQELLNKNNLLPFGCVLEKANSHAAARN
ncbi:MAG: hypothetical protein A3E85_02190 [Gammaproteobacteria bacterium RIFCSPHIGHO2_12_FULL_45_12]|nr:MAG: hypothetical protein A3E85_02190 [Gammaproteobacteria bacterium RIFCSPHIGHO2_12_FULL_45_12]